MDIDLATATLEEVEQYCAAEYARLEFERWDWSLRAEFNAQQAAAIAENIAGMQRRTRSEASMFDEVDRFVSAL